jgi:ATP-dependent Clp protease ATP-binding subunit ClpB
VDSKPEELDELDRRIIQLKIEREALKKEKDDASKERLVKLEEELRELESESASITEQWQAEKNKLAGSTKVKEELEKARQELEQVLRKSDYNRAGQLQHQIIPELERRLKDAEQHGTGLMAEEVTPTHIASVVSRWTGIPVDKMLEGERDKLLRMEEELGKRVIGQKEALEAVSNAVRRSRAGLGDPNRPIGSFLFLGPTGVGKTELTKALAAFLFDDDTALTRIDMSEYMEKHSVARLIGAPPGYVGYEEGGALTEVVRRRPYQVVLFDEVEKAHPDVFNVLLQVLDDGRLTDGQGRTVDFKNTLIVLTSNLGADVLANQVEGQDSSAVRDQVMEVVRRAFRPEFLNRLDEILLFHRLFKAQMAAIVDIQVARVAKRLEERGIELKLDAKARAWLGEHGYDPVYGARPLKRVIQRSLENTLAMALLQGEIADGGTVPVSAGEDGLIIDGKKVKAAA